MTRILLVGAGGLSSPAALTLTRCFQRDTPQGNTLTLIDDDSVDATNLHRQTLYTQADVGTPKIEAAARRLESEGARVEVHEGRLLPDNALELVRAHDLVIEGADNFATKFLVADATAIAGVPVVQAGAVRWSGWALASIPGETACMRCVFEDIPRDRVETCAEAGVVGPVVGVLGGLQALLALRLLRGDRSAAGELHSYRALAGSLRKSRVRRRPDCPLCAGRIDDVRLERYTGATCL